MKRKPEKIKLASKAILSGLANRKAAKNYFIKVVRPRIRANRAASPEFAEFWLDITFGQWLNKWRASHCPPGYR